MSKRKSLSKRIRFEVFKRDSFTCQYCGEKAPDVILHVDHIKPVAGGGDNDILNLITSCHGCNAGMGARELDDNAELLKQRAQLEDLNERRNQLDMMLEWRSCIQDIDEQKVTGVLDALEWFTNDFALNETGKKEVRRWIKKYDYEELLEVIDISFGQYLDFAEDGKAIQETWEKSFRYVPRIIISRRKQKDDPTLKDRNYIRAVLRNRVGYVNEHACSEIVKEAQEIGVDVDWMKEIAKTVRSWSAFKSAILESISIHDGGADGPH